MKTATILIVDDETNIRLMLRTTLRTEGYAIREAADGRAALKVVHQEVPDLMLLDLSMPQMDGIGVLQELKNLTPSQKPRIIVLTAHGSIPMAVKATRLGAIDFLEKPILPVEVREAVDAALAAPQQPVTSVAQHDASALDGGYAKVLDRVRKALRLAHYTDAETLLMTAADLAQHDPSYFNLLGVLYETQQQWQLARKFYGKAIHLDKSYPPAQQNMRRLYELHHWGRSTQPVTLGDETDVLLAQLAASH